MRFQYKIDERVEADVVDSALWYEEQREGLGDALILSFEEAINHLCMHPYYEVRYKNVRIFNVKRFPYQVIYFIEAETIVVIGFLHAHRNPGEWQNRFDNL